MKRILIPYWFDEESGLLFSDEERSKSPVRTKFFSDEQLREFYKQTKIFAASNGRSDVAPVASHVEGAESPIDNQVNERR